MRNRFRGLFFATFSTLSPPLARLRFRTTGSRRRFARVRAIAAPSDLDFEARSRRRESPGLAVLCPRCLRFLEDKGSLFPQFSCRASTHGTLRFERFSSTKPDGAATGQKGERELELEVGPCGPCRCGQFRARTKDFESILGPLRRCNLDLVYLVGSLLLVHGAPRAVPI